MARHSEVPTTRRAPERGETRRWQPSQYASGPWGLLRQMQDQMDRWFTRVGGGGWGAPVTSMSRAAPG